MTYLSEVLADSPLCYWRLADPGGSKCTNIGSDASHAYPSDVSHRVEMPYSGPNGEGGSAFAAGGSAVNSSSAHASTNWSIECLVWYPPSGDLNGLFAAGLSGATFIDVLRNGSLAQLRVTRDGVIVNLTAPPNIWHHVVQTSTGVAVRTYLDGVLINTNGAANARSLSGDYWLGRSHSAVGLSPSSWIAELAIYGQALSQARITAHYNAITSVDSEPVFRQATSSTSRAASFAAGLGVGGCFTGTWTGTIQNEVTPSSTTPTTYALMPTGTLVDRVFGAGRTAHTVSLPLGLYTSIALTGTVTFQALAIRDAAFVLDQFDTNGVFISNPAAFVPVTPGATVPFNLTIPVSPLTASAAFVFETVNEPHSPTGAATAAWACTGTGDPCSSLEKYVSAIYQNAG